MSAQNKIYEVCVESFKNNEAILQITKQTQGNKFSLSRNADSIYLAKHYFDIYRGELLDQKL
jgi:hypothetical protein